MSSSSRHTPTATTTTPCSTSMDPRQLLLRAAYLNDRGFALMESGNQHEAFETFVVALESMSAMEHSVNERKQQRTAHRAFAALPSHRRQRREGRATDKTRTTPRTATIQPAPKRWNLRVRFSWMMIIIIFVTHLANQEKKEQNKRMWKTVKIPTACFSTTRPFDFYQNIDWTTTLPTTFPLVPVIWTMITMKQLLPHGILSIYIEPLLPLTRP